MTDGAGGRVGPDPTGRGGRYGSITDVPGLRVGHARRIAVDEVDREGLVGCHLELVLVEGDTAAAKHFDTVFYIPEVDEFLSPLVAILPLQLMAYFIADYLGKDVDQPRNLAKSVTVE